MNDSFTQGATLSRYTSDMTKFIDNIREGRDNLHDEISRDEEERANVEAEIQSLSERLATLNDALGKKYTAPEELFRAIESLNILRASWVKTQHGGRLPKLAVSVGKEPVAVTIEC